MLNVDGRVRHSSQDLLAFVRCDRLTALRRQGVRPSTAQPPASEASGGSTMADLFIELGEDHEDRVKERYAAEAGDVVTIDVGDRSAPATLAAAEHTRNLLHDGVPVVHQGVLLDDHWMGYADFLVRVDSPSSLGSFSYEAADAKLGREVKAAAIVQTSLYSLLLAEIQGYVPERLHLDVGGGQPRVTRPTARSLAYTRRLMDRYLADHETAGDAIPEPEPVPWCASCEFQPECDAWWRDRDDLVHVAGLRATQRTRLRQAGIETIADLAAEPPIGADFPVAGIGRRTLDGLASQAAVQVATRERSADSDGTASPVVERLEPERDDDGELQWRGLLSLPPPSPGDVFYDIEGDPLVEPHGLEYLHGVWLGDDTGSGVDGFLGRGGEQRGPFVWVWADDPDGERRALELIVDLFVARIDADPGAHIYHYAPYETAALFRLAQRHATREEELDTLLRDGRFVDLYATVRQGLRVGAESYSIKTLEQLYLTSARHGDVAKGDDSIVEHQQYRDADAETARRIRADIVEYNEEDCRSTAELRAWLEGHRDALLAEHDLPADLRPTRTHDDEEPAPREDVARELALTAACHERAAACDDPDERDGWETLKGLAGWHRRERKTVWAELYRSIEVADTAEAEASSQLLGGLRRDPGGPPAGPGTVRYRAADQDHRVELGDRLLDVATRGAHGSDAPPTLGTVVGMSVDPDSGELLVDLDVAGASAPDELVAVGSAPTFVPDGGPISSLHRTIEAALAGGLDEASAAMDLLRRRVPRELGQVTAPDPRTRAIEVARVGEPGVLAIQGPPGTGKTELAATLLHELVADGRRVGITALSHNAITEVVERTIELADDSAGPTRIGQAVRSGTTAAECREREAKLSRTGATLTLGQPGRIASRLDELDVIAGTVWLWSRPELARSVDVLLVDEASQLSLANTLAAAAAADRLVLVGDPQQLTQPTRALHPADAGNSALDHLLDTADDGLAVVAQDKGVFLDTSYRMHPDICRVVSELAYDGQLEAVDSCQLLDLRDAGDLDGPGVRFLPVAHTGNSSSSPEEADVVRKLVDQLLGATFIDQKGRSFTIDGQGSAVITPYNAQVARLEQVLPDEVRRGTVDRFQGKTAAVVIVSLAASSADDAPRGLDFLLDRNRLNVALSRARAAVLVVGSPALMDAAPLTIRTIEVANDLCRVADGRR